MPITILILTKTLNEKSRARASLDFRIGFKGRLDPRWKMRGTLEDHLRKQAALQGSNLSLSLLILCETNHRRMKRLMINVKEGAIHSFSHA